MNQPMTQQMHNLAAAGMQAMQSGDGTRARELLEQAAPNWPDASIWVALAQACHMCGDDAARLAALQAGEQKEPGNLRVRVAMGDYHHDAGDIRKAQAYYVNALSMAPAVEQLPPSLRQELARAQARVQENAGRYEARIHQALGDDWDAKDPAMARMARSVDILLGRQEIYMQEPTQYYFPGLPQVQFYEREDFDWVARLETHTDDIRTELQALLRQDDGFEPYLSADPKEAVLNDASLVNNPDWGAFYFWKDGEEVTENTARCPITADAIREIDAQYRIPGSSPSIMFSRLKPHTRIPPHNGLVNTRLIAHLPLIVPPGCGFRVGSETRKWQEGKVLIFDDSMEHEAWNNSDQTRVILLFEVQRPEITTAEMQAISRLFQVISSR